MNLQRIKELKLLLDAGTLNKNEFDNLKYKIINGEDVDVENYKQQQNSRKFNMNETLIKFIELCLVDGEISMKEREVIFRKSKELGVPEDECEIILQAIISANQKRDIEKEILKPSKKARQIKKSDLYFKLDAFINWFDEFQNLDKRIKYLDENISILFTEWATNVLPNNNSKDKSISLEHLKKLMKLKSIGSNSWFYKDFMQMKVEKGSVEWCFRDKINNLIESEGFIGYFIMSASPHDTSVKFLWNDKDVNDCVHGYNGKKFDGVLGGLLKCRLGLRDTMLLTKKSATFFEENSSYDADKPIGIITKEFLFRDKDVVNKILDEYNSHTEIYSAFKGFYKWNGISLDADNQSDYSGVSVYNNLKIKDDTDKGFIATVKLLPHSEESKRILLLNNKITNLISESNSIMSKLDGSNKYYFTFKTEKTLIFHSIKRIINPTFNIVPQLLLFNTNLILSILKVRDHLLNLLIDDEKMEFEIIFSQLESSGLFQTKFEQEVKGELGKINKNLVNLKNSIDEMKSKIVDSLDNIADNIKDLNYKLEDIDDSIRVNNLLATINTYQLYKINQNTK